ncbi:hypothetical protein GCM10010275_04530 [Streptomyces litmocidini]|uniref:hypothetical protein n=1 Tax=Streptomyces litmocidini TaxID=67318 RepID=UPI00167CA888|nr:hypothetical protein [Streptomyces litmocidini]GGU73054.1 hypothetical protein GCM10010275_04530 [Streptomyces litmocidini]
MISEPELAGGVEFDAPEVLTDTPPPRPPRSRRPWSWALGGAVLASAVWGGGLYAYQQRQDAGPDLGGYRDAADFCRTIELKALEGVLGKAGQDGSGPAIEDPALFQAGCSLTFGPPQEGYSASVTYTLHKKADPGPEFAPKAENGRSPQPVDGLGEQAFFDQSGNDGAQLVVLDGQAEFELSVWSQYDYDSAKGEATRSTRAIDLSGIDVPMTQDLLALMAALKK